MPRIIVVEARTIKLRPSTLVLLFIFPHVTVLVIVWYICGVAAGTAIFRCYDLIEDSGMRIVAHATDQFLASSRGDKGTHSAWIVPMHRQLFRGPWVRLCNCISHPKTLCGSDPFKTVDFLWFTSNAVVGRRSLRRILRE